jgi:phage terminase small subunit
MAATEKQKAFARKFIELGVASDAYRAAYNANKMSDNAIRVEAHRVLANPNVALIVEQLREKNAKRHEVTIDTITEMLKEDRELARKEGQTSAAVSAAMGIAKLHGLVVDKVKQDSTIKRESDQLSDTELEAIATGSSARTSEEKESAPQPDSLH